MQSGAFAAEGIDEILQGRTEKRQIGGRAGNTFSVATFAVGPSVSLARVPGSMMGRRWDGITCLAIGAPACGGWVAAVAEDGMPSMAKAVSCHSSQAGGEAGNDRSYWTALLPGAAGKREHVPTCPHPGWHAAEILTRTMAKLVHASLRWLRLARRAPRPRAD